MSASKIANPGDSAFFQTDGRLHGEPSQTPRTDAVVFGGDPKRRMADLERVGDLAELARELERENARLRFELQGVLDWYAALSEPGHVPAGLPLREIRAALGAA